MNSLMRSIFVDTTTLISVYLYGKDPSVFIVGKVAKVFSDALLVGVITLNGNTDGFSIINLNSIYQIEYETVYLLNLEKKIKNKKKLDYQFFNVTEEYILDNFFETCREKQQIIEIEDSSNASIIGKVLICNDEVIIVEKFNTDFSCFDGKTIIRINDINIIYFGGLRQKINPISS